ncbi:retinoblastoma-associated protein-like [Oncorhynchus clarkii lewisi]|uniref:retinoblastoma-associated protein-like n=1 Tax=Oncorhynchus clarkii lewisi TaxID=490388 RepID=UPI0039B9B881
MHNQLDTDELSIVQSGCSSKNSGYNNGSVPVKTDLFFPWILDVFQLTAFDFYKVIESFIKAEPSRSKDIVKYLELCEQLIMETFLEKAESPFSGNTGQREDHSKGRKLSVCWKHVANATDRLPAHTPSLDSTV